MEQHLTDAGAERALLAGLFQHGIDAYVEVADIVDSYTFGIPNNQVLFTCVKDVIENNKFPTKIKVGKDYDSMVEATEKINGL